MHTIGEFAGLGHVTPRMLRHYDAIGLLAPAHVDDRTGYRRYAITQLPDLLRITQLRDVGCSLDDVARVLTAQDPSAELERTLHHQRRMLLDTIAAESARLDRLDAHLRRLQGESMTEIEFRRIEEVTVYAASGIAPGGEDVGSVVNQTLPALRRALDDAGVEYLEPGVFWYESVDGTEDLRVWMSWTAGDDARDGEGWEVVTLAPIERAAVLAYRGDMAGIGDAWNALTQGILDAGAEPVGQCREIYLESQPLPESEWLTELVQPVR